MGCHAEQGRGRGRAELLVRAVTTYARVLASDKLQLSGRSLSLLSTCLLSNHEEVGGLWA